MKAPKVEAMPPRNSGIASIGLLALGWLLIWWQEPSAGEFSPAQTVGLLFMLVGSGLAFWWLETRRSVRAVVRFLGRVLWIVLRPLHDLIEVMFKWTGEVILVVGKAVFIAGIPLSGLYLLVRFVKWAWAD